MIQIYQNNKINNIATSTSYGVWPITFKSNSQSEREPMFQFSILPKLQLHSYYPTPKTAARRGYQDGCQVNRLAYREFASNTRRQSHN